jgi:hypothetical protein
VKLLDLTDRSTPPIEWVLLPCSPSFRGTGIRHTTGVQWRNLSVPEVAICAEGELPWARLRRFAA